MLLALAPAAHAAHDPFPVLLDWTPLRLLAPAPAGDGVDGVSRASATVDVPPCATRLLLDLQGTPTGASVDTAVASVELLSHIEGALVQEGARIGSASVRGEGYGFVLGVAEPGAADVHLVLRLGALQEGSMRIRGSDAWLDPACAH